jgi:hypothetical protein
VAWVLAAASVLWGLAISTRALGRRPTRPWLYDLHRFLGGLAVIFTAIHVVAVLLDSYTEFGPAQVLIPFVATWHPLAVAWGIVALYLLVAVEATSLLRNRITARRWRQVHLASFGLFATATIHALSSGTDRAVPLFYAPVAAITSLVVWLTIVRVLRSRAPAVALGPTTGTRGVTVPPMPHLSEPAGVGRWTTTAASPRSTLPPPPPVRL